ncbi:MAG: phosphodiester glycosidase family protein [Clostridia bacterium]
MRHSVILIPAYNPKDTLLDLINELLDNGFGEILVINDGSAFSCSSIFEKAQSLNCKVLHHSKNLGKGQALKTGFRAVQEIYNQPVITVDCDGQHQILDIIKIDHALHENPNALIMGARNFSVGNVPIKSYLGNKITASIFKLSTGVDCKDTQTGLRGIPKCLFNLALTTQGDRYDYEYNFLCEVAESFPIISVPIKTIYFNDNEGSHFRPLHDSLLIYSRIIKFIFSSFAGFLADIVFFCIFSAFFSIAIATVVARLLSGTLNFAINKNSVFRSKGKIRKSYSKYLVLFLFIMLASAVGTTGLSMVVTNTVLAKIIVDLSLFIFSYIMQKNWVFADEINYYKASKIWKSCACLVLVFYISFTALNRFIVPQNIVTIETLETTQSTPQETEIEQEPIENQDISEPSSEPIITQSSYVDENIQIQMSTIREYETDIYIAEITVSDSSYLQAGLAQNSFGTNVKDKTSEIAQDNDAILAINGDYYGYRDEGYVMRNGYLYRTTQTQGGNQDLVIYDDGSMQVIEETEISAEQLAEMGAVQILSFGPGLISDGEIIVDENSEVSHEKESNPRTAIGMIEPNHYIFLVSDGRTDQSEGLTVEEIAIILQSYDCEVAYNLDGGGSSTMVFMGEVINNPTSNGREFKERSVSDIVFIG